MSDRIKAVLAKAKEGMQKAIDHLDNELMKIRAGKASPAMLDSIRVDYYGAPTPVNQVAVINLADARTLTIQPYERNLIAPIERAIVESTLGITPQNDGILIRLTMPSLTEDRRKNLVKQTKDVGEAAKVTVRAVRRDQNDALKKLVKEGEPEDSVKAAEAEVQKMTDSHVTKIEQMLEAKEKEIMTV